MTAAHERERSLEDGICLTYETLRRVGGVARVDPARLGQSRTAFLKDPARFDGDYAYARMQDAVKKGDLFAIMTGLLSRKAYTTLVDVGCFDGSFFTAPMARWLGSSGRVYGLDRFEPFDFNGDASTPDISFFSQDEVLDHVEGLHADIGNLEFSVCSFDRGTGLMEVNSDGVLAVTGFRIPDAVSCYITDAALEAEASIIALVPVGTGRMAPTAPEFTPRSRYMRQPDLTLDKRQLHALLNLPYKMREVQAAAGGLPRYGPTTETDRFNYQVNMLAKQLVMLDRAKQLKERGYDAHVMQYDDGFGWGATGHHHLLIERRM